jgi:hypothetical protein
VPSRPFTPSGLLNRFFGSAVSHAAGYAIGGAVLPTLQPLVQDITNEAWDTHPVKPLSPANAAEASIRGLMTPGAAGQEAQLSGIGDDRFGVLRGLAGEPPGSQQLLELWNRDAITDEQVSLGLRQSRMRPEWYEPFKTLRNVLVPVSDLIRMAVREVFSPEQRAALDLDADYPTALTARARELGLSEANARDYWAAHWNLPSREEGADMWHRGLLSDAAYDGLLKALDYSPTWRSRLREISNAIPSLSDMVRFAVHEVYDPARRAALDLDGDYPAAFTAQARKHGLAEQDARDYWAAHWRLPSATQGYQMLWRDQINDAQLGGLLKALDYAPVWRDKLQAIAYHPLGRVDLRRMLAAGIIDRAAVKQGYKHLGYTDANAEILTRFAEQQAAGSTTAQPWANRARSRVFTAAWSDYLDGNADEPTMRELLNAVGIDKAEQDIVVRLATVERDNVRRDLSQAQILKLYKKAVWTRDKALAALRDIDMTAQDAGDLLDAQ